MAYWTFSDVFEEQGVAYSAFYGGFGLIAADNIPKASLNAFAALHHLGDRRIAIDSDSILATKLEDGGLAIALWNYAPPGGSGPNYTRDSAPPASVRTFDLELEHFGAMDEATVYRVDSNHGNSLALFDQMGRPGNLTKDQILKLQIAGAMSPPEHWKLKDGRITASVPPYGLLVLLIHKR
jgi:xylan 1,4-beta-xylosidase